MVGKYFVARLHFNINAHTHTLFKSLKNQRIEQVKEKYYNKHNFCSKLNNQFANQYTDKLDHVLMWENLKILFSQQTISFVLFYFMHWNSANQFTNI